MEKDFIYFDGKRFHWDGKYYMGRHEGKKKRLHVYVWEKNNGKVPSDCCVHHIDRNKKNNNIENLQVMTKSEHTKLHMQDDGRKEKASNALRMSHVDQAARDWHASKEGLEWHSIHGISTWENREIKDFVCVVCGKKFTSRHGGIVSYCSKNCKAKARRDSGVDDADFNCPTCGKIFRTNKYAPRKYCSQECKLANAKRKKTVSENSKRVQKNRPLISNICEFCGRVFESVSKNARFCSKKCVGYNRRKNKIGYVELICEHCHQTFLSEKSRHRKFCCVSCYNKHRDIQATTQEF